MNLTCTIAIATRNRLDDLKRTLQAISRLEPLPDEIIISADGCTDGTVEFVKSFDHARLIVNEVPRGSIGSRDTMIRKSSSDIVLSLDDDSYPLEPDFIRRMLSLFEDNPRLAVATFPQHSDEFPESLTMNDFGPSHYIGSYTSSSAAIRRSVFLDLGGYPTMFFHVYEEPDYALRCIAAGWQVRYETSLRVRHHYSGVQRNEHRIHHFQARNELWSVMMRCPFPWLIPVGLFRVARQFNYAKRRGPGWIIREPAWWLDFFTGLPGCVVQRKAIPWKHYKRWMTLLSDPAVSQADCGRVFEEHGAP